MTSLRIGLDVVSRDEGAGRGVCRATAFDEEAELVKLSIDGSSTVWVGSETLRDPGAAEAAPEEADALCTDFAFVYDRVFGTIPRAVARRWRDIIDTAYSYVALPPGAGQVPARAPVSVALSFSPTAEGPAARSPASREVEASAEVAPEAVEVAPQASESPEANEDAGPAQSSAPPTPARRRRTVRFGRVHAREFARKIGGSGGVPRAGSWPLGLDWRVLRERDLGSVDEVEREQAEGRRDYTPLLAALAGGGSGAGSPASSPAGSPSDSPSSHSNGHGRRGRRGSPKRRKHDAKGAAASGSPGTGAVASDAANALLPLNETERRVCILAHALDWRETEGDAAHGGDGGAGAAGRKGTAEDSTREEAGPTHDSPQHPPVPPRSKSQAKRERERRRRQQRKAERRQGRGGSGADGTPDESPGLHSSSPGVGSGEEEGAFPALEPLPSPAAPEAPTAGVDEDELRRVTTEHEVENLAARQELEGVRQARAESKNDTEEAEEEERLGRMPLNRLRDLCREAGVDVRGSKGKLVQRLAKHGAKAERERAKATQKEREAPAADGSPEGAG